MKAIFLLFNFLLFQSCFAELPTSICQGVKPFKTKDNHCENFINVCIKTEDKDCKTFLDICEQCPAMNYSVLMFHDVVQIKVELQSTKITFNKTTDDLKKELSIITNQLRNTRNKTNNIYILLWVIIGMNILLVIILILEIRFKLLTKFTERKNQKARNQNYELLESRKSFKTKSTYDSLKTVMTEVVDNISIKIENTMDEKFDKLFDCLKISAENKTKKIKFRINGQTKPLELKFEEKENIVQIKKDICSKLTQCYPNDYKILKLKVNGKILDDNGYLPFFELSSSNWEVFGEFDKTIEASNIVVLNIKIDLNLTNLIQVEKNKLISNLVFSNFGIENSEDFTYFISRTNSLDRESFIELEKEKTIEESNLQDDDTVCAIKQSIEELSLESIFEKDRINIEYSNTDKISEIKNIVAKKFNCSSNDIILFLKNINLEENMFAFQYFSEKDIQVKYCRLINFELADVEIEEKPLVFGCFSCLYKAKFSKRHQDILIKKYEIQVSAKFNECKHIISELKTFQITKSEERFVKLFGVYKGGDNVYISMENMNEGSLKMFLKKNKDDGINLNVIAKWTYQILEGLSYLHKNNITHRDLNPSSLLLDSNSNIKLSSFNLSKYTEFHTPSSIDVRNSELKGFPIKYLAPEIIFMEICTSKADVWSLGAILIRIYTKKNPYCGVKTSDLINRNERNKHQIYEYSDSMPTPLKEFIDLCVKEHPYDRAPVESLQKDKFIQQYYPF